VEVRLLARTFTGVLRRKPIGRFPVDFWKIAPLVLTAAIVEE
jgi:hypothetical protein